MRFLVCILAVAGLCAFARAQTLPKLSAPTALDVRVTSAYWHPHALALLYLREEEGGIGLGIYKPGDIGGAVLLHLQKDEQWESRWFESAPAAIITSYRDLSDGQRQASVHLLDAKNRTLRTLYEKKVGKSEGITLDFDLSPAFIHAIFRVKSMGKITHLVLPIGGKKLVAAPELDAAVAQGSIGPAWSIDGTAVYWSSSTEAKPAIADLIPVDKQVVDAQVGSSKGITELVEIKILWTASPPPPPVGTAVLELIPSNPILRQVRFKGEWQPEKATTIAIEAKAQHHEIEFGLSRGGTYGLWLTQGDHATLVSASTEKFWMAPNNKAVAYLVDGALIVRMLVE